MSTQKKKKANRISTSTEVLFNVIVGAFSIACIIPFVFVLIISFSSMESIADIGYSFFPKSWSADAYVYAFIIIKQMWRIIGNSLLVTAIGTFLGVIISLMYAYAIYRKDFKYRKFFKWFCIITMLFNGGLVPTYIVCRHALGLVDSYASLIIPVLLNPLYVIIMQVFLESSVPSEVIDAAKMDGAGEYSILLRVVAPIAKPGIAIIATLYAVMFWNDWLTPMLYIKANNDLTTLQQLLNKMWVNYYAMPYNYHIQTGLSIESLRFAIVVITVLPIACAYPFFQRHVVKGLRIGAIKG